MPVFFIIPNSTPETVDHGDAPEGAIIVDNTGERPFWRRKLTAAALAMVLDLQAIWVPTRWDAAPKGTRAILTRAILIGAVGIPSPEAEEATVAAAISAIVREPELWNQEVWHGLGYQPSTAPEIGACGTAHCLAGWMQALLPLDHPFRKLEAADAGTRLAPRAAAAGWFGGAVHPDLNRRVEAAKVAK